MNARIAPLCEQATNSLSWLLEPLSVNEFLQAHWCRAPLRLSRNDPRYYESLLSEDALEHALYAASGVPGAVEILSDDQHPQRARNYAGAQEALRKGRSIRIDAIQRFSRILNVLARSLERQLNCIVNINMYFSPGSSRALKRHYDTHDVFVLQIHGKKKWKLFESDVEFPLEYLPPLRCENLGRRNYRKHRAREMSAENSGAVNEEFTLRTGDLLYLPRGHWHVAEAEPDQISCHLTVGAQAFTYLDLMSVALSQVAADNVDLRKPLPRILGADQKCLGEIKSCLSKILISLPSQIDSDRAVHEVAETFVRSRNAIATNLLKPSVEHQLSRLHAQSTVLLRGSIHCAVSTDLANVHLLFEAKRMTLPLEFEPAFRFVASEERFVVREMPGGFTDDEKLALVEKLIREGLLYIVDEETMAASATPKQWGESGWLPVAIDFRSRNPKVEWRDFKANPLSEPMFAQSVARLRAETPSRKARITALKALASCREERAPCGFIFHISRCGSTLVSNAMKSIVGTEVISEPALLGPLMTPAPQGESEVWPADGIVSREDCLRGAIAAFGRPRRPGCDLGLIVKFTSWQILSLALVRKLWPDVPYLIVIRDPVEVMVSCLASPPGWFKFGSKLSATCRMFGWRPEELEGVSRERICAKALGEFFHVAAENLGGNCRILSYPNFTPTRVPDLASFFGIDSAAIDSTQLEKCFSTYSKDRRAVRLHIDDREQKQSEATDLMRQESELWAAQGFRALIEHERLHS
jgi:bifunctional lysine-specific demethylase and histidyl-hydroxylase NO66